MPRGAKKKYDPKPGELFHGVLIVGYSSRPANYTTGVRWVEVLCPTCKQTRETNLYSLARGLGRQCRSCAARSTLRARRAA